MQASESTPLSGTAPPRPKCNDALWAVIYLVFMAGMLVLGAIDLPHLGECWSYVSSLMEHPSHKAASAAPVYTLLAVILAPSIAAACATWWLTIRMMSTNAKLMFNVMFGLSIGLMCADVALLFMTGAAEHSPVSWVVFILIIIMLLFFWCTFQIYIPFAACCIEVCITFLNKHAATFYLGFISLVPLVLWILYSAALLLVAIVLEVEATPEGQQFKPSTILNVKITVIAFGFYWTQQVLANIVHVSVCGAFGSWYYNSAEAEAPVWPAVGRACTWSFGSISLGSLLVAIVRTLRMLLARDRREGSGCSIDLICNLCADCLLRCLEEILKLFNKYAFTYVAIYGQPFCEAAKSVLNLFERKGLQTIINDDITSFVLTLATTIGASTAGLSCFILASFVYGGGGSTEWVCALSGATVGGFIVFTFVGAIDSSVATLFVCFAENPDRLQAVHPANYAALSSAWNERYLDAAAAAAAASKHQRPAFLPGFSI